MSQDTLAGSIQDALGSSVYGDDAALVIADD